MGPNLEKAVIDLGLRMRMISAMQEEQADEGALSERERNHFHVLLPYRLQG